MKKIILGIACLLLSTTSDQVSASECNLIIDKPISPDTELQLESFLSENAHSTIVCFNSPGGSLVSGLNMLRMLRSSEQDVQTVVKDGDSCLSACAIAFMGGKRRQKGIYWYPWRTIYGQGKLGFHRPYFILENAIDSEEAERLFEDLVYVYNSLNAIEPLIDDDVTVYDFISNEGKGAKRVVTDFYRVFPAELLALMNANDSRSEMVYIDDRYLAASFGISIPHVKRASSNKTLNRDSIIDICKIHDAAFVGKLGASYKLAKISTAELDHGFTLTLTFGDEEDVKGDLKMDDMKYYDVRSRPSNSSLDEAKSGYHCYIFTLEDEQAYLVFESRWPEAWNFYGPELYYDWIKTPFNRIPFQFF